MSLGVGFNVSKSHAKTSPPTLAARISGSNAFKYFFSIMPIYYLSLMNMNSETVCKFLAKWFLFCFGLVGLPWSWYLFTATEE